MSCITLYMNGEVFHIAIYKLCWN